ncbi:MAG: DUF1700 domain-containing protein [Clostridiales bacterium]|nr:DUF1700 domain-containing protein [Clostridiales bacterium]
MNQIEFIERLRRTLAGSLSSGQVAEHVRYYQEYIRMEMGKGRSEAEVLAGLGDPRLLAKSIIEASKRSGVNEGSNRTYDEEMAGGAYRNPYSGAYGHSGQDDAYDGNRAEEVYSRNPSANRVFRVPGWLILLIITVAVVLVIGLALSLISVLAPIMIPVLIAILLVWVFRGDGR